MARIEFKNDISRALEEAEGSDGRMNVSSRSDERAYYNSRDEGQCYSITFEHSASGDGQYSLYLQNTSTVKTLVVSSVGVNADNIARIKLWSVTGTAGDGVAVIPKNLNLASPNDAAVTCLNDGGGTPISGLTVSGVAIDDIRMSADGHRELRIGDRLRLGQNDAIAIEMDTGTSSPLVHGVAFFYFE